MWKKFIAVALTAVIFLSVISVSASLLYGVNNHWAGQYAVELNKMGIFNGDENGYANLFGNITRAEFLALLVRAMYPDEEMSNAAESFADVKIQSWYYDIAFFAKAKGIVLGDDKGRLLPDDNITREEIVLMLVRALGLKNTGESVIFSDVDKDYLYYDEISCAVQSGIIRGYPDGSFGPGENAARGEAAAMIARMLGIEADEIPEIPANSGISGKINMTWHQIYTADVTSAGEFKDGLNVISPTWFRITSVTDESSESYEYKLNGDNSFYLQDLGDVRYISDARTNGYKVWALFKSDDFSANNNSKFLNDESARKSSVDFMRQMIIKYNLDGINMDFENMLVSDKDKYTTFVKEMSDMTKEMGVVLSVDVTKYDITGGAWSLSFDRKEIAHYADYVILMAYDQNGVSSSSAGSVGDMTWVENAVLKTLEEVPSEKLILGIPFYARLWQTQDGRVIKTRAIGMDTAQRKIAEAGAKIEYDKKTGQNYAAWELDGVKFEIWLEDQTSVRNRIAFAENYSLAGISSWSMGFENSSIWNFIKENLYD